MNPDDDPLAQLLALKAKQSVGPDPLDELMKTKAPKPKIGQMGHAITTDESAPDPSYATQALGGIASLAHDIPGAEAAQAGVRSFIRRQPYTEALSDIRGAEDTANKWVTRYNNLAGGTVAAGATPGSNVALQGARFGVGEAMGSADPISLKDRIDAIPGRASIDALAGKLFGEVGPNIARTAFAKRLGKNVIERTGAMEGMDRVNFGKAKAEGDLAAANPTPQAVSDALNDTDIKPYVAVVRGSGLFKNADDPTVLREAYKLIGEKERTLGNRIVGSDDFKAGSELERKELIQGKRTLSDAAKSIMPSFAPANLAHANAEGELDALKAGADATGRIITKANVAGKKLATNSSDAFLKSVLQMRDAEAKAAVQGVLGKLKETAGLNPLRTGLSVHRAAPYISALDKQAYTPRPLFRSRGSAKANLSPENLSEILRAAGISVGPSIRH